MTDDIIATLDHVVSNIFPAACACMGPQGDEPLCPCAMRNVVLYKGRYVRLELLPLDAQDEDWADVQRSFEADRDPFRDLRPEYWSEKAINQRVTKMDPKRLP